MRRVIEGWVHKPGLHCGSVALRDVISYYGYDFSEAMCFGLGAGLGFFYTVGEELSPTRIIHLRGAGMEPNFFNVFGIPYSWRFEDDADTAFEKVKDSIDRGVPVLLQTDIRYLDYYNSSTHFPGHVVGLWGYDEEKNAAFLSDTGFEGLMTVPLHSLRKARASKAPPYPLSNNWFEVNIEETLPPLSRVIPKAIRKNAELMLEGLEGSRGISSVETIRVWAKELPQWAEVSDWKWCARFAYQVIERRGTGGGGFRFIYRDFLKEAEEIVPKLKEFNLPQKMDRIGRRWSKISDVLKEISEGEDRDFSKVQPMVYEVADLEEEFYKTAIEKVK